MSSQAKMITLPFGPSGESERNHSAAMELQHRISALPPNCHNVFRQLLESAITGYPESGLKLVGELADDPVMEASYRTLAKVTGLCTKSVQRSIQRLLAAGALEIAAPYSAKDRRPAWYRLPCGYQLWPLLLP